MIISLSRATSKWLEHLGLRPATEADLTSSDGSFIDLDPTDHKPVRELFAHDHPRLIVGLEEDLIRLSLLQAAVESANDTVEVRAFAPSTFRQVMEMGLEIGRRAGRFEVALKVVGEFEKTLWQAERLADLADEPMLKAVVMTSTDPITLMGRWAPQVLKYAGFIAAGPEEGDLDAPVSFDELQSMEPDIVVLALDGEDLTHDAIETALQAAGLDQTEVFMPARRIAIRNPSQLREPGPELVRVTQQLSAMRQTHRRRIDF